jgi:glycosyltransferase involved in cell wall biosynthesis
MTRAPNKIFLVSGSWPPAVCGVGDFMDQMYNELKRLSCGVSMVTLGRRDLITAFRLVAASYHDNNLIYMSYPTEGYGKSLWPFLLTLGSRSAVVVHIHEYSSKNKYARFLLRQFKRLRRLYFSNEHDIKRYIEDCGLCHDSPIVAEWRVMPSPSNIPVSGTRAKSFSSLPNLVHFGQIRPHKGLERLPAVFELLDPGLLKCFVVGGVPIGYAEFARSLILRLQSVGVFTKLNLSPAEISQTLADTQIGVFPFPDGADERRGSLIAALAHGVLCVTTHSERTPNFIKEATIGVSFCEETLERRLADAILEAVTNLESPENLERVEKGREIGRNSSFRHIAHALINPYTVPLKNNGNF